MKLLVCAAYDGAVRAYLQPFFSPTKASAIRSFSDAVQAEGSQFAKHYADFHLALLGEFDDSAGSLVSLQAPERLISASECLPDDVLFPPAKRLPM